MSSILYGPVVGDCSHVLAQILIRISPALWFASTNQRAANAPVIPSNTSVNAPKGCAAAKRLHTRPMLLPTAMVIRVATDSPADTWVARFQWSFYLRLQAIIVRTIRASGRIATGKSDSNKKVFGQLDPNERVEFKR